MKQTHVPRERTASSGDAAAVSESRNGAHPPLPDRRLEIDVLLCSARTKLSGAHKDRLRELLQQPIDWPYLLQLAYWHRVTPLLYQSVNAADRNALPPEIYSQLRRFFHWNGFSNHLRTNELLAILKTLGEHDIAGIPFKGPLLATHVYEGLALRQFADLDILIQPQNLAEAEALLFERGYKLLPSTSGLRDWQEEAYLEITHQRAYVRPDETEARLTHVVELQWKFASHYFSSPLLPDHFWKQPVTTSLADATVRAFETEDLLLFLCMHGTRHVWSRLQWVCDVAELMRRHHETLDWERVFDRADELGLARILRMGLDLAHTFLDAPLPAVARARIEADPVIPSLREAVWTELFDHSKRTDIDPDSASPPLRVRRFHLMARERGRDKARYLLRGFTPTQKDWSFLSLPRSAGFLYYLLRPVRIARDFFSPSS